MLSTIRVKNFRSFRDSGPVPLSRINILLGANNAGKSALMSAIQLAFTPPGDDDPLDLRAQPSFASFDSLLRRYWSPHEPRPRSFTITYGWSLPPSRRVPPIWSTFAFAEDHANGRAYVSRAAYGIGPQLGHGEPELVLHRIRRSLRSSLLNRLETQLYTAKGPLRKAEVHFFAQFPYLFFPGRKKSFSVAARKTLKFLERVALVHGRETSTSRLVVVLPYRPVPRTYYVLDDPNMASADRDLISHLMGLWGSEDPESLAARVRIRSTLRRLGIASSIDVIRPLKRGINVAEVRVAAKNPRQKVTIADVGFGVSQVLPLAAEEAGLANGTLIAYQPEMHLHPLAQSRLADVLMMSMRRGNQVFVETHSEHIVLRLQYLIARRWLRPSDVTVLCIEHLKNESKVTPMDFDRGGVPSRSWPAGFLDTGLKLASDLTRERLRR